MALGMVRDTLRLDLILALRHVIGDRSVSCRHRAREAVHIDDCLAVGMLCVRADVLRAAGGFPASAYGEDAELIEALSGAGLRTRQLETRTYLYHRDHGGGLTARRAMQSCA